MPAKSYNRYEINGASCTGYARNGRTFLIDTADYEMVKPYCWCFDSYGYLVSRIGRNAIKLHRLLLPGANIVDHINGDKSDNRKANLRSCTEKENARNRLPRDGSASGIVGVYRFKRTGKWYARIAVDGKRIFLGQFDNLEDAKRARTIAELRYFGEFSRTYASLIDQYGDLGAALCAYHDGHDTGRRGYSNAVLEAAEVWKTAIENPPAEADG